MPVSKKKTGRKTRRRNPATSFLGKVFTEVAGAQYYDAVVLPGERIQLEREPGNEHDANAIRIENGKFRQVGYVPRRISSWLAPLVDSGEIWVEGAAAPPSKDPQTGRAYVLIEIHLHRKGRHILERDPDPKGTLEGLHQAVLAVWQGTDGWTDGDMMSALADRLKALGEDDLPAKTSLLLSLFKDRAWRLRRKAAESEIGGVRERLKNIGVGRALFYRNLTIFPLVSGNSHKPDYLLLADAISREQAEVREVSEQGSVPELVVDNRAAMPLLIPEGEILIGAKQNRTVNITIMIAARTEHVIPVSCVEQGRWSSVSDRFASSHWATPGLRSMKISSSQSNRRTTGKAFSDQGRVWADVREKLEMSGTFSQTSALTDAYRKVGPALKEYQKNLVLPGGTTGILVAVGGEVLGMDLFDSPKTMRRMWPRISKSYFLEAAFRDKEKKALKKTATGFLKALPPVVQFADRPAGSGKELEFSGEQYSGSGLWYNEHICHLSAFRLKR